MNGEVYNVIIRGGNEGGLDGIDVWGTNVWIQDVEVTNKDECVTIKVWTVTKKYWLTYFAKGSERTPPATCSSRISTVAGLVALQWAHWVLALVSH
jgi:hypothetical protein